jgi:cell division transport system permease protein
MKIWLTHHLLALRSTLAQMLATPFSSLFTLFAIGITLSLPAGMAVMLDNATQVASNLPNPNEISIYMDDDATPTDINKLRATLSTRTDIAHAQFVAKQTALTQISQQLGLTRLVNELPKNPLPDAWIITPANTDAQHITQLVSALQKLPHVALVQADYKWSQRLDALLQLGRDLFTLLASILAIALTAITSNTIRLQISTRHAEIEVSRLIGATDRYIRRPFLYFGALQGLLGGIIAWSVVFVSTQLLAPRVQLLATLYATTFSIQPLSLMQSAALLLTSTALGWIGAYFAVSRSLARIEKR